MRALVLDPIARRRGTETVDVGKVKLLESGNKAYASRLLAMCLTPSAVFSRGIA